MRMTRLLGLIALCVGLSLGTGPSAQDAAQNVLDAESWEATASRAEEIIQRGEASSPALETLRSSLAKFRSEALDVQDAHAARITTLESQLTALGASPGEGETEAPEVAARRSKLSEQLVTARAPVLAAQEAYKRADGLIGEIDAIIRERQAARFFTLGASPLNLSLWPDAFQRVVSYVDDVKSEVNTALGSDAQSVQLQQNLPVLLVFLVLGLALTTRARSWALRLAGFDAARRSGHLSEIRALCVSATQVIVPMLGIWSFLQAIQLAGIVSIRGAILIDVIPYMALSIFGSLWIGRTLFTNYDGTPVFFNLDEADGRRAARAASGMGLMLAVDLLLEALSRQADWPENVHVVLDYPVVVVTGILLVRVGLLLERYGQQDSGEVMTLNRRVNRLIARGIILLGVAGPLLATVGYFTASISFVFPAVETLALLGTGVILFRLLTGIFDEVLNGGAQPVEEDSQDTRLTMMPVIFGFALILLGTPLLALIWGARVSDLLEVWSLFSEGFALGDRRISVTDFLTFAIVFALGYTLTRLLQSTLRTTVLPRTSLDLGGSNALVTGTGYVGVFLAALAAITAAGLDLSSVAIVAGALSVGIGFGLQAIVSNFVSGIILLIERPIKEGDWIEVGAFSGYVRKISVRATEIETFDRSTVVVPNADFISGTVTNYTHSGTRGRVRVPVGVAYDSDPRLVEQVLTEIANGHHMIDPLNLPAVVFMGFGVDSMDFEIRAILKDVNWMLSTKSDMNYQIVKRFREEGIEIPFSQRDVNLRNISEIGKTLQTVLGDDQK